MNKYISKLNLKQRVAGSAIILVVIMSLAAPVFSESLSDKEQKLIDSNNRVAEIDKQAYALQLARNEERGKQQCLIKDIAKLKLRDFYNGKTELSKERVQELVDKSNWSCDGEVAIVSEAHAESVALPRNEEKSQVTGNSGKKNLGKGWRITTYYTPVKGQPEYFLGSYDADFNMNCSGDCTITASGHKLKVGDEMKIIACPSNFKLGTEFWISGVGYARCEDRGGAIKGKKLDLWVGIGYHGRMNVGKGSSKNAEVIQLNNF